MWDNIRKLAGEERKNQLQRKPPLKMHGKKKVYHGGARPMAGRKKSKPKELLVTPVKIKNLKLGHYIPKGKKEFIPFQETEFTIEAVEEVLCNHFLGVGRIVAKSSFNFHIMRTLKGPPLKTNLHLTGTSFYFWWQSLVTTDEIENSPDWFADNDLDELPSDEQLFNSLSHSSVNTGNNYSSASTHEGSLQSTPSTGQKSSGSGSTVSSVVRHQLSVRAEQLANIKFLRTAVRSNIPKQPLPTPSKILLLGRSVAIPKPQYNGVPAEVYLYSVSDDWCSINVEGPEHSVIEIDDYPEKPFASGCFQVAFTAKVISVGGKFLVKDKPYVFKQHNLHEYGLMEDSDSTLELTEEFLHQLRTANEKKTAKEVQVGAVCCSLCYHFTEECKRKIPDYGKELNVLPSVHVKLLSGQCPAWGLVEPRIQGTWYKFLNNDAQEVDLGNNVPQQVAEFSQKSIAFAHWTFDYFKQRALVCDLQGADFNLTDLEIASNDSSLFGIGNLSEHALGMFKNNHKCNVYCVALDLQGFHSAHADVQILASPEVLSLSSGDSELLPSLRTLLEVKTVGNKKLMESQVSTATDSSSVSNEHLVCRICLSNKIDVVFYKCGHMFCCEDCAIKLNRCCPVCRAQVDEIVKIYL